MADTYDLEVFETLLDYLRFGDPEDTLICTNQEM
jgi:hypothetical protein